MDATALRASTLAVTPATSTAAGVTTNGPSSSTATTGGGPTPAPAQPTLLGVKLLPAPPGEPQPIHLPDGSMLVPLARVNADGSRTPLRAGGAASAPLAPATAPVSTMTAPAPAAPSTPASSSSQTTGGGGANFEPKGFLYNDRYFKKFANAGGIAVSDVKAVEERVTRATFAYLLEEEPEVDDYGVTNIRMRRADPARDADLIAINPRAHWIVDVDGVQGNGQPKSIPSVVNSDGAVFVDPRITRG